MATDLDAAPLWARLWARLRPLAGVALRFGAVGVAATLFYFGQAQGFLLLGWPVEAAHLVAQATSLLFSYFAQKRVTFGVSGGHRRFGPRFAAATAALVAVSYALVAALDAWGLAGAWVITVNTVFYPAASFVTHTFWTFAGRRAQGDAGETA